LEFLAGRYKGSHFFPLPNQLYGGSLISVGSYIYYIGGSSYSSSQSTIYCFNYNGNTWSQFLPGLLYARSYAAVGVIGNMVIICGGMAFSTSSPLSTCESFVANVSAITSQPSLPEASGFGGGVVIGTNFYVVIGTTSTFPEASTGFYVFNGATWTQLPPIFQSVSHFAITTFANQIYVIGGYESGTNTDWPYLQVYDVKLKKWVYGLNLLFPSAYGSVVLITGTPNAFYLTAAINQNSDDLNVYRYCTSSVPVPTPSTTPTISSSNQVHLSMSLLVSFIIITFFS